MLKPKKLLPLSVILPLIFLALPCISLADETLTITTYYPSPYGVYNELRLFPHTPPTVNCDSSQVGLLYYDNNPTSVGLKVCTASGWQSGTVVQIVSYETGEWTSGINPMAIGSAIPQNTEGDEYMTLTITPKSATNKLRIDATWNGFNTSGQLVTVALFRDNIANALAAVTQDVYGGTYHLATINLSHIMDVPDTATHTFKVRAGNISANRIYFNGNVSGRLFGGVMASSIIITEYTP